MCIVAAVSFPGGVLCASDSRWSLDTGVLDAGSKVRRSRDGWSCATGSAPGTALGLRRLEQHGLDDVRQHITAAYNEVAAQIDPSPSCFLGARDDGTLLVNWTAGDWDRVRAYGGRVDDDAAPQDAVVPHVPGSFNFRLLAPPGLSRDDEREAGELLKAGLGAAKDVNGIVAAVASAFMFAHRIDSVTMSSEFECGVTVGGRPLHTRCPAERAARGELRFTDPPVLPPFPGLAPERAMFELERV